MYCCDIVTFNTIALKGAIRDVCRGLFNDNLDHMPDEVKKEISSWDKAQSERTQMTVTGYIAKREDYPQELVKKIKKYSIHKEVPYEYISFSEEVIDIAEKDESLARERYPEVFKYVDLVNGVVVSVGNHPSACIVSPYPVDEWFGTFTTSGDEYPISVLNMKEIDSLNFIKLDVLGLANIGLIYKTCDAAGIKFATPDNIPPDDQAVWDSIRDDTTLIFQFESDSATAYLKQLFSDETISRIKEKNPNFSYIDLLSMGNGAIRPAGESYRDALSHGIYHSYGNEALDEFMKPTLGYMVYQCQIIEFLNKFCGYTMGQADTVRRAFSKKLGTDKHIPKIKEGFIKTMKDKYGIDDQEAEKLVVDFIRVIEDASDYLFSKNHSDPYSWIGYICGYLRYYYPLEFITSALNIFADNEEKSLAIIAYAKKRGIPISPIKFRHSISQYSFDKESGVIFKGISSIKFLNEDIANEMYELRNNTYNSFIDLLIDLQNKTSLNSRQLQILIELDFFEEFGDCNKLLETVRFFDELYGKKQMKKEKCEKLGIPEDAVIRHCGKATEKTFMELDSAGLLAELCDGIKYKPRKLKDKVAAQVEHLGYVDIADPSYDRMLAILDVDTKYAPKIKAHSLKNGSTLDIKIDRRTFNKLKIAKGDIILVRNQNIKPKQKKNSDGEWEPVPGTKEIWLTDYRKVESL